MLDRKETPITVITGYLGSGKTTVLNHLLTNNEGLKIGVIVNDFGDVNIDAQLIEKQSENMLELTNGCVCCSQAQLDLRESILQFIHAGSKIDYIVIEASGLAQSRDLVDSLIDCPVGWRLDGIVAVVDAENIEKNAKEHELAIEQIEYGDFVIINKTDLVDNGKLNDIRTFVKTIKPKARVFEVVNGAIDPHFILDQHIFETVVKEAEHNHGHQHNHVHHDFTTFTFEVDQPLDPTKFQNFVNNLLPTSIYRAKGFVDMGQKVRGMSCEFQLVGSRASIKWNKWGDKSPQTQLVFIGRAVDEKKVIQDLSDCIDKSPDDLSGGVTLPHTERS